MLATEGGSPLDGDPSGRTADVGSSGAPGCRRTQPRPPAPPRVSPHCSARHRTFLLSCLVVLCAGCQLDARVLIDVVEDGSGLVSVSVALDQDAADRVPELADQLEVDDLVATGWTVTGPALEADGLTWVRASKPFPSPGRAALVLDEVTGAEGPFQDLAVRRSASLLEEEWRVSGAVDLREGLAGFSDDALRDRLDGTDVGRSAEEIAADVGRPIAEVVTFEVAVSLPGDVRADGVVDGRRATWEPVLGERLEVDATGSRWNVATGGWLALAAAATTALVAVLLVRAARRLRRRHAG